MSTFTAYKTSQKTHQKLITPSIHKISSLKLSHVQENNFTNILPVRFLWKPIDAEKLLLGWAYLVLVLIVKLWELYCYYVLMSMYKLWCLRTSMMSTYLRSRLLNFCVMYVLYVLIMDGAVILLWVCTWRIFFSTNVSQSDAETPDSRRLDFWHVSFGKIVIQSDVNPLCSWRFKFGPPGSWLMLVLVSLSIWLLML